MRLDDIDRDRRRNRVSFLANRLRDFASARTALLLQLETLDAQASAAQVEHNFLCNLDAPISSLPDEVLAMIFEQGMHMRGLSYHFGVRVSHVTQRWRNISIATPKFWTSIRCIVTAPPYPEISLTERVSTFLSRARSSPLDIYIAGLRKKHLSSGFLQAISDHIGHCRQLRIAGGDYDGLMTLLQCTSSQPMPLLSSLELGWSDGFLAFRGQLFPFGVPRLTTACIHAIDITTIHYCVSAFESLTSLQLSCLVMDNCVNDVEYSSFREALMAIPSLHNLDLSIQSFEVSPGRLPILLPRIQHLHMGNELHYLCPLGSLLHSIQAASLVALSLSNWGDEEFLELIAHGSKPDFPSLQHVILVNFASDVRDLTVLAQAFPDIERLTFKPATTSNRSPLDINHILDTFLCGAGDGDIAENGAPLWPKVQSIALSTSTERFTAPQLSKILRLRAMGHPIRKLLLPQDLHPAMAEVEEIIEVEEFYVDWPIPFEW